MKGKWFKPLCIVLALAVVLLAGPGLVSRLCFHRSLSATVFELELRFTGRDAMNGDWDGFLAEKTAENSGPVILPEELPCTVSAFYFEGMEYFVFAAVAKPERLVFYFPGGTFLDRPQDVHYQFAARLAAETGAEVVLPIYPRLPGSTAADVYPRLEAFYRDFTAGADGDSVAGGPVIFLGDSAGGGLALVLAQQLAAAETDGPDRLILLSPWLDLSMENPALSDWQRRDPKLDLETLRCAGALWAGELDVTDPLVSPLFGDTAGLGSITLFAGTRELLYPDILRFSQLLDEAGTPHTLITGEGMNHIWPLFQSYGLPESEAAFEQIAALILS